MCRIAQIFHFPMRKVMCRLVKSKTPLTSRQRGTSDDLHRRAWRSWVELIKVRVVANFGREAHVAVQHKEGDICYIASDNRNDEAQEEQGKQRVDVERFEQTHRPNDVEHEVCDRTEEPEDVPCAFLDRRHKRPHV